MALARDENAEAGERAAAAQGAARLMKQVKSFLLPPRPCTRWRPRPDSLSLPSRRPVQALTSLPTQRAAPVRCCESCPRVLSPKAGMRVVTGGGEDGPDEGLCTAALRAETWANTAKVCEIVRRHGGVANAKTGVARARRVVNRPGPAPPEIIGPG